MEQKKITFKNKKGETLAGKIFLPVDRKPHSYAIFAHCFTCSKNLKTVKNISNGLTEEGYAVLGFDFTGLGESEGDFSETDFSHDIEDLIQAADYLKENYQPPNLIIGHSLGGTASIYAAKEIESIKAFVCIASPYQPKHVKHLFKADMDQIEKDGEAEVDVGGRNFKIKKSFLDDLEERSKENFLADIKKSFLVLHSPQDKIVAIENAEKLYKDAKHPKSFISLDGANHLLTDKQDSLYAGKVIAGWAMRYLDIELNQPKIKSNHAVVAHLNQHDNFTTEMKLGNHYAKADEPKDVGGSDFGPNPYELVAGGLAACTAMTLQLYAKRKEWNLTDVEVHINHSKEHKKDSRSTTEKDAKNPKLDQFERKIKLKGDLDEKQKKRLLEIANKCPVHRTLHSEVEVKTSLEKDD
ncbi:MAG: alpha/beta fold hydrolase [Bacteroidota bacterium]